MEVGVLAVGREAVQRRVGEADRAPVALRAGIGQREQRRPHAERRRSCRRSPATRRSCPRPSRTRCSRRRSRSPGPRRRSRPGPLDSTLRRAHRRRCPWRCRVRERSARPAPSSDMSASARTCETPPPPAPGLTPGPSDTPSLFHTDSVARRHRSRSRRHPWRTVGSRGRRPPAHRPSCSRADRSPGRRRRRRPRRTSGPGPPPPPAGRSRRRHPMRPPSARIPPTNW